MDGFAATILTNLPDWGPRLLDASRNTFLLTVFGFAGAFLVGLLVEFCRTRPAAAARTAAETFVWVLRGLPLLVVLYLLYFALPGIGIKLSAIWAGILGLTLAYGAYLAEVFRAGLRSIPRGQREAALALGLTPARAFGLVVFPQALRIVLPPLLVSIISLLKDSSVCALIAVNELTLASRAIMSETFLPLHIFVVTGLFYFSIAWPASLAVKALEARLSRKGRRIRAKKPAMLKGAPPGLPDGPAGKRAAGRSIGAPAADARAAAQVQGLGR